MNNNRGRKVHKMTSCTIHNTIQCTTTAIKELRTLGIKYREKQLPNNTRTSSSSSSLSSGASNSVFGCSVDKVKKLSKECCGLTLILPEIVKDACEHLREHVHIEGIFRKGGSQNRQRDIKNIIDNGGHFDKNHHPVDVASLLKLFLRSLPEPIIGVDFQDVLLRCLLLSENVRLHAIQCALLLLPITHIHILHYIMEFFNFISLKKDENKMDANNLAIVVAPSLMPPPLSAPALRMSQHILLIQLFIEHPTMIGKLPNVCISKSRDGDDREIKIKKKRRSGSLTRVFSGLKKMVSGGNPSKAPSIEILNTPIIKESNHKRKHDTQQGLSAKKRREVVSHLPLHSLATTPLKPMNDTHFERRRLSIGRLSRDKLVLTDSKKDVQESAISGITFRSKTENTSTLTNKNTAKENDYVRISKSEYEDIKNRVSAIENKISQEFNVMSNIAPVKNVQNAYEKTLEEAAMLNSNGTEHLAKRLSRELKIRRSDEHKIIRSPSARKIENLKRRSLEHVKLSRTSTWNFSSKTEKPIYNAKSPEKIVQVCPSITLKRGRPNTLNTGLHQPSINSNSCDPQPLIDIKRKISLNPPQTENKEREMRITRSTSFHDNHLLSKSNLNYLKPTNISTPDKSNSSDAKWTNASTFLSSLDHSHNLLTGRASVAQLRSQNAGMVMAKARLFDGYSDSDNSTEKNVDAKDSRNKTSFARKPRKHSMHLTDNKTKDVVDSTEDLKSQLSNYRNNIELSSQLKEVIYDTCTPVSEKISVPLSFTPLKRNENIDVVFKTPQATPLIRRRLSEKSVRNNKSVLSTPSRRPNTPLRANHAIPRRQSPRLMNMKSRIMHS